MNKVVFRAGSAGLVDHWQPGYGQGLNLTGKDG